MLYFPTLCTVRTLISRTEAHTGCGRPTLNVVKRFKLGSLHSDTAKPLDQLLSLGRKRQHRMNIDWVAGLARM